ncbi:MAG: phosphate signaling complex protein PhoU [Pseudomonadota bacterium]
MDSSHVTQHISRQFNEELENVRQRVLAMGGLVEEQIGAAMEALVNFDTEGAEAVIRRDEDVDQFELEIDEQCTRILAKRQPAAGDLRLIVAILKTITDLERIGDEAEKIARMSLHIAELSDPSRPVKQHYGALNHLGLHVKNMLHLTLDAFARMDVDAAIRTAKAERQSDDEYNAISRQILTYMLENPRNISPGLDVMWSARALERIGDHARNICEYVVYMVEGKDVRHTNIDKPDDSQ